jgi:hypothetical protein
MALSVCDGPLATPKFQEEFFGVFISRQESELSP